MKFSISEAARMYGKHRATLHRHIKHGRLSCGTHHDGSPALDLSELIRCYGEPSNPPEGMRQSATDDATPSPTGDATPDSSALLDEIRKQTAVIERMSERIERLEAALLRLPAPAQPTSETTRSDPTPKAPAVAEAQHPPRDFGDLLARFESRNQH